MHYKFDTGSIDHAQAALILYAIYRSRGKNSSLNGLEIWDRFNTYVRGASLKSNTTAEFVHNFCKSAKIDNVNPKYLKDLSFDIMEDNSLLKLYENEGMYIIMLVRDRIQREKEGEDEI